MSRQVADTMNWDYYESVDRFQRILDAHGITEALKENGAKEGDLVSIEECRPISKRKTWVLIARNGEPVAKPEGLVVAAEGVPA